ncbi:hypothetical protein [Sutcliffiella horikoshii]|nr:hypothetical protein [Sutcliffiella horikoshii]
MTRNQEERGAHRRYEALVTRNQQEKGPHRRYEDLGDKKSGGERSSSPL